MVKIQSVHGLSKTAQWSATNKGKGGSPDQSEQSRIVQNMNRKLGIWFQKPWCGITGFWSQTLRANQLQDLT